MSATTCCLIASLAVLVGGQASAQLPVPAGSGEPRRGAITGIVADSAGTGIVGATIFVVGSPGIAVSDTDGAFRLTGVTAGSQTLVARRIGFRPESLSVSVPPDSTLSVVVHVEAVAHRVAPMVVTASNFRYTGRLRGFNERRDRGIGRFFTAEDIEKRSPRVVSDLLRMLPGTRVSAINGQNVITFRGLRCPPLVWLDGTPATAGYLDVDAFAPMTLAGIEVYSGLASVPAELAWMRGKSSCGVIALWTKLPEGRGRPGPRMSVEDLEALIQTSQLYTADGVDTPAAIDSAHPIRPVFPDSLRRAAVGGRVVAEFVVDINGRPNMSTFSAVLSTHEQFTDAVRSAIGNARFTPAWLAGRRVRQLVQLPFAFAPEAADGR